MLHPTCDGLATQQDSPVRLFAVVHRNLEAFFSTLSAELAAQADRVRHLIGPIHWVSDGNHKEALLRGLVERYAPEGTLTSRAFVVDVDGSSTEQDVVVVDTLQERPLFNQGGLLIATPQTVLAAISVKTRFRKREAVDGLSGLTMLPYASIWRGLYFFEAGANVSSLSDVANKLKKWLGKTSPKGDVWIRVSEDVLAVSRQESVVAHRCPGLATPFFLARCLNAIAAKRGNGGSPFAQVLDATTSELETVEVNL